MVQTPDDTPGSPAGAARTSRRPVWTAGHCAALACQIEASIPKPGNVHRGADFEDTSFPDFLVAGQILGNAIDRGIDRTAGEVILDAVEQTRLATGNNPNLGIVLLVVPLAMVAASGRELSVAGMQRFLESLTPDDARLVGQAIRRAAPGGLGSAPGQDVRTGDLTDLREAMESARHRDQIAAEWASGFAGILEQHVPRLRDWMRRVGEAEDNRDCPAGRAMDRLERAVILLHVELIARHGDSLIARKCGAEVSSEAARRAARCLDAFESGWAQFAAAAGELDFWMRSDGNRRNPGSTADLIAATLFASIWQGLILPDAEPPGKPA